MESSATSASQRKGKNKVGTSSKSRWVWSKKEEDFLVGAMTELFGLHWRMENGQFRNGFLGELEKRIIKAFLGTDLRAVPHIESKLKQWRKQYNYLYTTLGMSGFGWNDTEKMIQVDSNDVWDTYVKRDPEAKNMRNRPFLYYDEWCLLFGKDTATGELAEGPADAVAAFDRAEQAEDEGYNIPLEAPASDSPMSITGHSSNKGGSSTGTKKRGREKEGISKSLSEMANAFGSFFHNANTRMGEIAHRIGYAHDLSKARKMVNVELRKLPLDSNQRLRQHHLL